MSESCRMSKHLLLLLMLALFALVAPLQAQDDDVEEVPAGPALAAVRARGQLVCAIDSEIFGFGFLNPNTGEISGIQADLCRALAVATVGEAAAVDFRLHELNAPIANVLSDEVDVLFHHTLDLALQPAMEPGLGRAQATIFYDGTSVMTEVGGEIADWDDLENATVCTVAESLSAQDFRREMERRDLDYDEVASASIAEMRTAFEEGRCSVPVLDRSLLEIIHYSSPAPDTLVVWPMPFTRREITPFYPYGDSQWADIIDWTIWGLIQAEKLGITSENIDQFLRRPAETNEAYISRVGQVAATMLDPEIGLGYNLSLSNDFMAQVIRQVGNYGEIYERHLGSDSALPIERGLNALWLDGGLLDAPAWQ